MGYVQIIEIKTSKYDEIRKLEEEWQAATEGRRTATRSVVTEDRDQPGTYVIFVEFPSYEAAQANNDLPETAHFSEQVAKLGEGLTFRNLDVVDDNAL
jgi:quinol monooxygenase YgiN